MNNLKRVIIPLIFITLFVNKNNAKENNITDLTVDSIISLSNYYYLINNDSSIIYFNTALNKSDITIKNRMYCLSKLSTLYYNIGRVDTAFTIIYKAINIGIKNNLDTLLSKTYINLGNFYTEIKKYNNAKIFYKKSINTNISNSSNLAWGALGILYSKTDELDSALFYLNKSHKYIISLDTTKDDIIYNLSSINGQIGIIYFDMNLHKTGFRYFNESLRLAKKTGNKLNIISNLLNISVAYNITNKHSIAEEYLMEAYALSKELKNSRINSNINKLLSEHYYNTKNYKLAYKYLNSYYTIKDSLIRKKHKNSIHNNELEYLSLIQNEKIKNIEFNKEKETRFYLLLIVSSTIIFILITIILYFKVKSKSKETKKLHHKATELKSELKVNSKNILDLNINLSEQNKLIQSLQDKLKNNNNENIIKELENSKISRNKDWQQYIDTFLIIHSNFFKNIESNNVTLSEGDKRQLIMLKLEYSKEKSSSLLGISPDSVKRARQRLSKKLKLEDVNELYSFISTII